MNKTVLSRVYVWEIPVRFCHWLDFLAVVVLCVTGYLIGRPLPLQVAAEASFSYWFGWIRFIHFVASYIFFFTFLFRLYWGFTGNSYANWKNFIIHRKSQLRGIGQVLKVDVFLARVEPLDSIGINPLGGLTYFLVFLAFSFQALTGFGMYSAMSNAWLPRLFSWVVPLMGGDFAVRQWHHMFMWFFVLFAMIHVYLVFYHDYVEGRGSLSSMAGGWKFIEKDHLHAE